MSMRSLALVVVLTSAPEYRHRWRAGLAQAAGKVDGVGDLDQGEPGPATVTRLLASNYRHTISLAEAFDIG